VRQGEQASWGTECVKVKKRPGDRMRPGGPDASRGTGSVPGDRKRPGGPDALGRPPEFACQVPRVTFRAERDRLLLAERGDAVVVLGKELAIVGE
jgi:hypothetical protein